MVRKRSLRTFCGGPPSTLTVSSSTSRRMIARAHARCSAADSPKNGGGSASEHDAPGSGTSTFVPGLIVQVLSGWANRTLPSPSSVHAETGSPVYEGVKLAMRTSSALTPPPDVNGATLPAPAPAGGSACAAGMITESAASDTSTAAERWYLMTSPLCPVRDEPSHRHEVTASVDESDDESLAPLPVAHGH